MDSDPKVVKEKAIHHGKNMNGHKPMVLAQEVANKLLCSFHSLLFCLLPFSRNEPWLLNNWECHFSRTHRESSV